MQHYVKISPKIMINYHHEIKPFAQYRIRKKILQIHCLINDLGDYSV